MNTVGPRGAPPSTEMQALGRRTRLTEAETPLCCHTGGTCQKPFTEG